MTVLSCMFADLPIPSLDLNEGGSFEFGSRFNTSADGYAVGVRFYRGIETNVGPHYGHIWDNDGVLLGTTEPFDLSEPLGWQQAPFMLPVRLKAGREYVVSYTAPENHASVSINEAMPAHVETAPLNWLANCYATAVGVFPVNVSTNSYYADVLFTIEPPRIIWNIACNATPGIWNNGPALPNGLMPGEARVDDVLMRIGARIGDVPMPWVVPSGWELNITDVLLITKDVQHPADLTWGIRHSYMHLGPSILTVTAAVPMSLHTPFVVASGTPIGIGFQNASPEVQNMDGFVSGYLMPANHI